ncbi:MAG: hypothetical protein ACRC33_19870, partial [Gemmataceae bacterium]
MPRVAGLLTLFAALSAALAGGGGDPIPPDLPGVAPPPPPTAESLPPAESKPAAWNAPKAAPPSPPEPPITYVNAKAFRLHPDIRDAGPARPKVEVWLTRDGKAWTQITAVEDPHGPIKVAAPAEGRYGFTLVARSEASLGDPTPKTGDAPQQWVEVDVTPPTAELLAPEVNAATAPRTINLRWRAADRNLTATPITLYWSATQTGPWETVGAAELPNAGSCAWTPPPHLPPRAYLRLAVRDRAGNVAEARTADAVVLDTSLPRATIRKVEADRAADGPKAAAVRIPDEETPVPPVVSLDE